MRPCSTPFSFADFFKDSPWFNIPPERHAVFIAPLYPRGGLLGGASEGGPKVSKLQALAAARKKKAQEQKLATASGLEQPMTGLSIKSAEDKSTLNNSAIEPSAETKPKRGFPIRKRKDSNEHEKVAKSPTKSKEANEKPGAPIGEGPNLTQLPAAEPAEPSAFANALFSFTCPPTEKQTTFAFNLWAHVADQKSITDAFSGPSPDDIVIAAQAKGSAKSSRPKK